MELPYGVGKWNKIHVQFASIFFLIFNIRMSLVEKCVQCQASETPENEVCAPEFV